MFPKNQPTDETDEPEPQSDIVGQQEKCKHKMFLCIHAYQNLHNVVL